jgi:hypothetical protein
LQAYASKKRNNEYQNLWEGLQTRLKLIQQASALSHRQHLAKQIKILFG